MKRFDAKNGFSLIEVIAAVAILAVLVGILLGVGSRVKNQGDEKLAKNTVELLVAAIERYYDYHGEFPLDDADAYEEGPPETGYGEDSLELDTNGVVNSTIGTHDGKYASSEALYYFLDKTPVSREVIETIDNKMVTGKDDSGVDLMISIDGGNETSLLRFIDPWGNSIRYTCQAGDNFPVIESAGVDGNFDTKGDNISSK